MADINYMVDLETLSPTPNAHVLEISFLRFDIETGEIDYNDSVIERFGLKSQNRESNAETIKWWLDKNQNYFMELCSHVPEKSVHDVVLSIWMKLFLLRADRRNKIAIWNTGSFDVDILNNVYKQKTGSNDSLIRFYEIRDVRSIRQIGDMFNLNDNNVEATHNAKEDCIRQIEYITKVVKKMKENG